MNWNIEDIICDLTFTPWKELPDKLTRLGIKFELYEEGESLFIDNGKIRTGLIDSDPITKAVQFGFALVGERWASSMPDLLPKINKEWKQRAKKK